MADYKENRVTAVYLSLTGSYTLGVGFTDHTEGFTFDSLVFESAPQLEFKDMATLSIAMDSDECKVSNIPAGSSYILTNNLKNRVPYPEICVQIFSLELEDDGSVNTSTNVLYLWNGLIYSVKSHLIRDDIEVLSRNAKYYADRVAGMVCHEQCTVGYFGDSLCTKTVTSQLVTIDAISGYSVEFTSAPTGADYLYKSGILEFAGLPIKILDWRSATGDEALLALPAPTSWVGQAATIYSGCDRTYQTCVNIHDNAVNFRGLGVNMVAYNTYYESE